MSQAEAAADPLDEVLDQLAEFEFDPLGFVLWAFPWGVPGTSLAKKTGPEKWQVEVLTYIGEQLRAGGDLGAVVRTAVSAGRGVGKSALVCWIILWAIATFEDTRGSVTANTESQLRTKTWAELAKWHQLFIARELFVLTATAIYSADPNHAKTWRIDAVPWAENKPEAIAGAHNEGKRALYLFDEASPIPDPIWEFTEGSMTEANTQIIWAVFGNHTRTSGTFHKITTRSSRWKTWRVDAREVSFANLKEIEAWIEEYGLDSDYVRVHVLGLAPRAGFSNFIGAETVEAARRRTVPRLAYQAYQKILAVDPARFGDDWSVITLRQGLKVHFQIALSGFDGPELCGRIMELVQKNPGIACIAYDANGNGADLDSALRRAPGLPTLIPVMWSVPAKDDKKYFNQRSECWGAMKDWLAHGEIPDDDILADELTSLDYFYDALFRIQLESKKDAKKNHGKSPDRADSLAISFVAELIDRKVVSAKVRPVQRRKVVWSGRVAQDRRLRGGEVAGRISRAAAGRAASRPGGRTCQQIHWSATSACSSCCSARRRRSRSSRPSTTRRLRAPWLATSARPGAVTSSPRKRSSGACSTACAPGGASIPPRPWPRSRPVAAKILFGLT